MSPTVGNAEIADAVRDFHSMARIRAAEEAIQSLRLAGTIVGSVHLSIGQEAIPVGVVSARRSDDPIFATYRGHGWAISCGVPLGPLFAELCGRETGLNGGRGGSAYFSAAEYGFYGENSIVGAGAPIALGAAVAAIHDGSGRVAVCAFGDGALNQGAVHEALNFAAVLRAPVVFVCENNLYSELTPISSTVCDPILVHRAAAYGMLGVRVDGNDVQAVRDAAAVALARARQGEGPTLIEALTERLCGHYVGDAESYRDRAEVEAARVHEPLVKARQRLSQLGVSDQGIEEIRSEIQVEVGRAIESAINAPFAEAGHVRDFLYA